MRHGKKFNHLGRKAMLANMACSLIDSKRITTTVAKAKALRTYIEPLITKSKDDTTHNRRTVFSYLQNKEAIKELFDEISGKVADRPGGYTRIIKLGSRLGDDAEMALIELVDYNELMTGESADKKKAATTTRRSRRGGSKAKTAEGVEASTEEKVEKKVAKKSETKNVEAKAEDKAGEEKNDSPVDNSDDKDKDKEADA
jgi:large subunit ribosomal protein L17